jgi:hypothetical protein
MKRLTVHRIFAQHFDTMQLDPQTQAYRANRKKPGCPIHSAFFAEWV